MSPPMTQRILFGIFWAALAGVLIDVRGKPVEYMDNSDALMRRLDLDKFKGLFDDKTIGVNGIKAFDFTEQADAEDERLFFGVKESHTKDNCYIIRMKSTAKEYTLDLLSGMFKSLDDTRLKHELRELRAVVVCFKEGTLPAKLLKSIPGLDIIERDCQFQAAFNIPTLPHFNPGPSAMKRLSYDNTTAPYKYSGAGVNVYIVDSGIETGHVEFGGRAKIGFSLFGSSIGDDCSGHGTSVASCVGGSSVGLARNVNLIGVQVLDCDGSGSTSGMLSAIDWLKKNAKRPCVVNMSFVGPRSPSIDYSLMQLVKAGIPVTVAAGNFNKDASAYSPNGDAVGAIAVGATDAQMRRASFSNYGAAVDLFAPGRGVPVAKKGGSYGTESGTSFSAPLAAAVCAMVLERIPDCPPDDLERIVKKIALKDNLEDLKGSPNLFLQVPNVIASKSELKRMMAEDDQVAIYSSYVIAATPISTSALSDLIKELPDSSSRGLYTANSFFMVIVLSLVFIFTILQ
mgnify:CR=1 FL=1